MVAGAMKRPLNPKGPTIVTEISNNLYAAICDLPAKDAKTLLKALNQGLPLNRRLRNLLAQAEDAADESSAIEALVASEYITGDWGN